MKKIVFILFCLLSYSLGLNPPSNATVSINNGVTFTNTFNVGLTITCSEATSMNISNTSNISATGGDFSDTPTESYTNTKSSWKLASSTGLSERKNVYILFTNASGNIQTKAYINYDGTAPGLSVTIASVNWTSINVIPKLDFGDAVDDYGGSGVVNYEIAWSTSSNSKIPVHTNSTSEYTPLPIPAANSGKYFLRASAIDNAKNVGDWVTIMSYEYDGLAPGKPGTLNNVLETSQNITPLFDFEDAVDTGGSSVNRYEIYWGSDPDAIIANKGHVKVSEYNPGYLSDAGTYYLRARAIDNAGNSGEWQTILSYEYNGQGVGIIYLENKLLPLTYYVPEGSQKNLAYYVSLSQTANVAGSTIIWNRAVFEMSGTISLNNISLKIYEDVGASSNLLEENQYVLSSSVLEDNRITLDLLQRPINDKETRGFYIAFNLSPTSGYGEEAFCITLNNISGKYMVAGAGKEAVVIITGNTFFKKTFSVSGLALGYSNSQNHYLSPDDSGVNLITFNLKPYTENTKELNIQFVCASNQSTNLGYYSLSALTGISRVITASIVPALTTITLTTADMAINSSYDYRIAYVPNQSLPAGTTIDVSIIKINGKGIISLKETTVWSTLPSFNIFLCGITPTTFKILPDSIIIGGMQIPMLGLSVKSYFTSSTLNNLNIVNNLDIPFSKQQADTNRINNLLLFQDTNSNNFLDDFDVLITQSLTYSFSSPNTEIILTINQLIPTYSSLADEVKYFMVYEYGNNVNSGRKAFSKISDIKYLHIFNANTHTLFKELASAYNETATTGLADFYISSYNMLATASLMQGEVFAPLISFTAKAINNIVSYSIIISNNINLFTGNDYGIKKLYLIEDLDGNDKYSAGDLINYSASAFNTRISTDLVFKNLTNAPQKVYKFIVMADIGAQATTTDYLNDFFKFSLNKNSAFPNIAWLNPYPKPERNYVITENKVKINLISITPNQINNPSAPQFFLDFSIVNNNSLTIDITSFYPQFYNGKVGSLNLSYEYRASTNTLFPYSLSPNDTVTISFMVSPNTSVMPVNVLVDGALNYSLGNKKISLERLNLGSWYAVASGSASLKINIPTYNVFYKEYASYLQNVVRESYGVTSDFRNNEIIERGDFLTVYFKNSGQEIDFEKIQVYYSNNNGTANLLSIFSLPSKVVDLLNGSVKVGPLETSHGLITIYTFDKAGNQYSPANIEFFSNENLFVNDFLVFPSKLNKQLVLSDPLRIGFLLSKPATVKLYLFNNLGQMVWNKELNYIDFGYKLITFEGALNSGDRIGNGIYLLKMFAKDLNGNQTAKSTTKFIVY